MSEMGLDEPDIEAPDADAVEQHLDVIPEPVADDEPGEAAKPQLEAEPPLEADEADAAEQGRVVMPDDDEYR